MDWIVYFIAFIICVMAIFMLARHISTAKQEEPVNRVHFYVARDKSSILYLYLGKPKRADFTFMPCTVGCCIADISESQEFGLNPDDFKDLKWEDEPIEVFLNMED